MVAQQQFLLIRQIAFVLAALLEMFSNGVHGVGVLHVRDLPDVVEGGEARVEMSSRAPVA